MIYTHLGDRYWRYKTKADSSWEVGKIYKSLPDGKIYFKSGDLCEAYLFKSCLEKDFFDEVTESDYNQQEGINSEPIIFIQMKHQFQSGDIVKALSPDLHIQVGDNYIVSRPNYDYADIDCINIEGLGTAPYEAIAFKLIQRQFNEPIIFI